MYKRVFSLLLAVFLSLSLAACGASAPETGSASETTGVAETTQAATEPTLSQEELLLASLPEKVRQAYDLGLVDLALLADLDRVCLGAEAAQIIQNIHAAHHGVQSKIMNQLLSSEHAGIEVTRYWLAQTMFLAEAESIEEAPYDDYMENLKYMVEAIEKNAGFNDLYAYFINPDGDVIHINDEKDWFEYKHYQPDAIVSGGSGGGFLPDIEEMFLNPELADQQELYVNCGDDWLACVEWVIKCYDRLTGEKIMNANEETPFLPRAAMTVQEVVETTLRYYNWILPQPEMLAYGDLPTYDTSIIPPELLARETTLPEASCQNLPASWRGIACRILSARDGKFAYADHMLQENEIQVIQDAGFNFLRLHVDFRYYASDDPFIANGIYHPVEGQMNESRLKELDQIIAWCMERDIHVNLVCDERAVGWAQQGGNPLDVSRNAQPLAEQWQIFARRYAEIPNTYLSFTLYNEPEYWQPGLYAKFFTPVVKAIQEVSPDRCIIAEMAGRGDPGEDMAALGVALSTKAGWPDGILIDANDTTIERNAIVASAVWPYISGDEAIGAEDAMTTKRYNCDAPDTVAAVAQEYGVGFMVSGWSPAVRNSPVQRERYSDEFMESYLTDFAQVLSSRGYGWCYGDLNGCVGLFGAYPAVTSTTYTQVDNAPLYIDDEMFAWFQTLNGVQ